MKGYLSRVIEMSGILPKHVGPSARNEQRVPERPTLPWSGVEPIEVIQDEVIAQGPRSSRPLKEDAFGKGIVVDVATTAKNLNEQGGSVPDADSCAGRRSETSGEGEERPLGDSPGRNDLILTVKGGEKTPEKCVYTSEKIVYTPRAETMATSVETISESPHEMPKDLHTTIKNVIDWIEPTRPGEMAGQKGLDKDKGVERGIGAFISPPDSNVAQRYGQTGSMEGKKKIEELETQGPKLSIGTISIVVKEPLKRLVEDKTQRMAVRSESSGHAGSTRLSRHYIRVR